MSTMDDEINVEIDINALVAKAVGEARTETFTKQPIVQFTNSYMKPVSEMIQAALVIVLNEVRKVHNHELSSLKIKIKELNQIINKQPDLLSHSKQQHQFQLSAQPNLKTFASQLAKPGSSTNNAIVNAVNKNAKLQKIKSKRAIIA
jgi:hypothetical protein